ncbi:hypothetical protein T4B_5365 [Trichinella pseudospiralis]|uniref:Uncharacterized protein n=2 Tax=Trichinella pseudospiralis TaxID=6337 RepID=A0A0V1G6D3_TRIPS|nr:hypothetical protein T4D_7682 [Trichinella pseudospiralis]KRZ33014.1 hypothetical protein T4B_5365 [Trichinella pseudospiralis]
MKVSVWVKQQLNRIFGKAKFQLRLEPGAGMRTDQTVVQELAGHFVYADLKDKYVFQVASRKLQLQGSEREGRADSHDAMTHNS